MKSRSHATHASHDPTLVRAVTLVMLTLVACLGAALVIALLRPTGPINARDILNHQEAAVSFN